MERQGRLQSAKTQFIVSLLLCGFLLFCLIGIALSRYEVRLTSDGFSVTVESAEDSHNQILFLEKTGDKERLHEKPGAWIVGRNAEGKETRTLEFLLANGTQLEDVSTDNQRASVEVIVTSGIYSADALQFQLTDGESSFPASAEEIAVGTTLYFQHGPGWIYRFYNEGGEELKWELPGESLTQKELTLTAVLNAEAEYDAALTLIASVSP